MKILIHWDLLPEPRIQDPKLICYSNSLQTSDLNLIIDIDNKDIETIHLFDATELHSETVNHPLENCIFSAYDIAGTRVVSKTFDFIRDRRLLANKFRTTNLSILDELTSKPITYFSDANTPEIPYPETLLSFDYINQSNEETLILLDSLFDSSSENVFLFNTQKIPNRPGDPLFIEQSCINGSPIYKTSYFGLERIPVVSNFYWQSNDIATINNKTFLKIPSKSSGTLNLKLELSFTLIEKLVDGVNISDYQGLIIAPNSDHDFLKMTFTSPNEFKMNLIDTFTIKSILAPNSSLSSLPTDFRSNNDLETATNSAFNITMINSRINNTGNITTHFENNRAMERELECVNTTRGITTRTHDGITTTTNEY